MVDSDILDDSVSLHSSGSGDHEVYAIQEECDVEYVGSLQPYMFEPVSNEAASTADSRLTEAVIDNKEYLNDLSLW
jgi:hypothetical protein